MDHLNRWQKLLSSKRFGLEEFHKSSHDGRTEFQRDYDRLIFSAPFRRLQNKTQVFPLPGSVFVHNRLTHSLEVSSVGRSLAANVARKLEAKYPGSRFGSIESIVAAACLAHDLGNPPFGHSGEKAIASYFSEGSGEILKDKLQLTEAQWCDFIHFDGNANAFRILTHQFNGRRKGGFVLTYATLASIVKYPFSSLHCKGKPKFGFFQSEEDSFIKIAEKLGLICENNHSFKRHPLVYLVEAADDICYQVMDLEDAHKLRILSTEQVQELFISFFPEEKRKRIYETMLLVTDINEQIAYLRSRIIGVLVDACAATFIEHEEKILCGEFPFSLKDKLPDDILTAYNTCAGIAVKNIYKSSEVLEIELAGYQIMTTLLEKFIEAVRYPQKTYSQLLLKRVSSQFEIDSKNPYHQIQSILDFLSGMTDVYALDLYRNITGINLPVL
ncbi:MAG: deoxyguanosinetriphosphate triphosphohydrolase [Candidatus Azobacteroides sp.]|nr:deoxyguanosinetriphosphate triphosphohydrolase [Candidatus Azobacteroides sp.]